MTFQISDTLMMTANISLAHFTVETINWVLYTTLDERKFLLPLWLISRTILAVCGTPLFCPPLQYAHFQNVLLHATSLVEFTCVFSSSSPLQFPRHSFLQLPLILQTTCDSCMHMHGLSGWWLALMHSVQWVLQFGIAQCLRLSVGLQQESVIWYALH